MNGIAGWLGRWAIPESPAARQLLQRFIADETGNRIAIALITEDASSPTGPALQLLSVPQSKKPRVVTSTSSWCTRLITTTPRNYIGCNNLNKKSKEIAIPALDGWATWVHRWPMPQTSHSRVPSLRYDMVQCVYTSRLRWAV